MNIIKSVFPLLSLLNIDTGRETAVETRPALPDWQPAGGDLVSAPGQKIDRVFRRVSQDGNVTIYEEEIIYLNEPTPAATPLEPQPEREPERSEMLTLIRVWRYGYESGYGVPFQHPDGSPVSGLGVDEIYRAAHEGRLLVIDPYPHAPMRPDQIELCNIANRARRARLGAGWGVQTNNGRIVIQE